MEKSEGGCVTAGSVWSLCEIACVRGVCEILVGWWSRTDQVRTEGSGNSSRVMNQQWKSSPCLCCLSAFLSQDHLDKAIELKPQDPMSYYLLGRWCYAVCDPPDTLISLPSLFTHANSAFMDDRVASLLPLLTHPRFPLIHSHCLGFPEVCFSLCDIRRKRYGRLTPAIVSFKSDCARETFSSCFYSAHVISVQAVVSVTIMSRLSII